MIKNTASQKVGVQMVSATDGSAFTGAVTVAVTVDAGTQGTGSVASGACTHEGNGYHTYAPAQAETNGDLIAFTFTGSGAVPQTVQVYTRAATPDVNVTQNAGANITAASGVQEVKVASIAANAITATAIASDAITDAKVASDVTIASVTGAVGSVTGAVGSVTGAVGSVTGNVGGNVVGSVASVTAGVTVTTNNDKTGYRLSATGVDDVLDETIGDSTITMRQALKLAVAVLAGKLSGAATTTVTLRNAADTTNVVVATVDADGNRTAVTLSL